MKLNTLNRIIDWFNDYQPNLENGSELYLDLIDEEFNEYMDAKYNNNKIEILDWLGDMLWVMNWQEHFNWWSLNLYHDNYIVIKWLLHREFPEVVEVDNLLDDLINEIADSNFTKSAELNIDWEKIWKVKKWDNFKKPDIQKIINKYEIWKYD